jgi:hypothetical protein
LPGGNLLFFGRPKKSRQKKTAPRRLARELFAGPAELAPSKARDGAQTVLGHRGGKKFVLKTPQGGF